MNGLVKEAPDVTVSVCSRVTLCFPARGLYPKGIRRSFFGFQSTARGCSAARWYKRDGYSNVKYAVANYFESGRRWFADDSDDGRQVSRVWRGGKNAVAPARHHPDRTAIQTKTFQIPSGTEISVRNDEAIDSSRAVEGQTYAAEVTSDVRDSNGAVVVPMGANAQLVITSLTSGGRFRGASDLVIALQSVSIDGQQYAVNTTDLEEKGRQGIGANKRTVEYVGGGAALGAIIGAITGQGKGAAIGAAAGAGGGALTEILTKGSSIKIPAETLMTFRLDQSLRVVERK